MVENLGLGDAEAIENWSRRLRAQLEEALSLLDAGDAPEAERRAKAVVAMVKAVKDIADLHALAQTMAPQEDEEDLRAQIQDRLARWIEADRGEDLSRGPDASAAAAIAP